MTSMANCSSFNNSSILCRAHLFLHTPAVKVLVVTFPPLGQSHIVPASMGNCCSFNNSSIQKPSYICYASSFKVHVISKGHIWATSRANCSFSIAGYLHRLLVLKTHHSKFKSLLLLVVQVSVKPNGEKQNRVNFTNAKNSKKHEVSNSNQYRASCVCYVMLMQCALFTKARF